MATVLPRGNSAVICVSQSTAQFNIRAKRVAPEKIYTIPNSIDPSRLGPQPSPAAGGSLKQDLGLQNDALVVTGIGRLVRQKRFDLFLEIAAMILDVRKNVSFLVVGDGPERTKLEGIVEAKGITSHVHFLGTRHDIGSLLDITDLFFLMSDFEGLPITLLESMAKGVCVIATDVDGTHDVLAGTNAGVLVLPGDWRVAAEMALRLLRDSERREKMAAAGREIVFKSYGIETTASRI